MNQSNLLAMATLAIMSSAITFSSATLAASKSVTPEATNKVETTKEIKKYERIVLDESMANRESKKYTINAAITGIEFGTSSTSIEAGYHLDTNNIVTLQYTALTGHQTEDADDEYEERWDGDNQGKVISIGLKKFTSNSFYIKPEAYSRTQEFIHSVKTSYSYDEDNWSIVSKNKGKIQDLGVSFKIGNQWQWDNFTLGCDWVGITRSLSTVSQTGKIESQQKNSASLLNFYMGATF